MLPVGTFGFSVRRLSLVKGAETPKIVMGQDWRSPGGRGAENESCTGRY